MMEKLKIVFYYNVTKGMGSAFYSVSVPVYFIFIGVYSSRGRKLNYKE